MAYNKTVFVNDSTPPISAENLNKIENGLEEASIQAENAYLWANQILTNEYITVFNRSVSGTLSVTVNVSVPSGTYNFSADSITSSDTDDTKCSVYFMNGSTTVTSISATRTNNYSKEITLNSDVNKIVFYAALTYVKSEGDSFAFTNVKISNANNKLKTDIEETNKFANDSTINLFTEVFNIEQGMYAAATGLKTASTTWCRSNTYCPKDVCINATNGIKIVVLAYNLLTDAYIGCWNGSAFSSYSELGFLSFFDCSIWQKKYPNYKFKLDFKSLSGNNITPSDVYSNTVFSTPIKQSDYLTNKTTDEVNNYVDYCASGVLIASDTQSGSVRSTMTFTDKKFQIDGTPYHNGVIRCTDTLDYAISGSDHSPSSYTDGILLKAKRRYRATTYITRGSRVSGGQTEGIPVSIYKLGESTSSGTFIADEKTFTREVSFETDTKVNICLFVHANAVFDCEGYVTFQDVTEEDSGILSYYQNELDDTISKVRAINDEPSLVFPVVTDIHRYKASVQTFSDMIQNIKSFVSKIKCDFVLNTGDTIEGDAQQSTSMWYANDSIESFNNIGLPFMYAQGNHDNNPYILSQTLLFDLKQVYSAFFVATKNVFFNSAENGTDYYFDFLNLNVRIIVLNSCNSSVAHNYAFGDSTATWLTNALDTDSLILLLSHVSPIKEHVANNSEPINASDIKTILNNFVNNGGKLLMITGHSHIDAEFVNPYVEITNVCQKFEQADISDSIYQAISGQIDGLKNPSRTQYTFTADAWTVVVLKLLSNEIDFIRFGAGVDRYIHYEPITPQTVTSRFNSATWTSSDNSVATVSSGVITGISSGRCAVIAKDTSNNIEVWVVEVA